MSETTTNDEFAPDEHKADEVIAQLEESSAEEKNRIVAEELSGKRRKSVLEAAGVDPAARMDATGRRLNPWEVTPTPALEN